jgi:DNA-binding CsgD family transcriptional regulator
MCPRRGSRNGSIGWCRCHSRQFKIPRSRGPGEGDHVPDARHAGKERQGPLETPAGLWVPGAKYVMTRRATGSAIFSERAWDEVARTLGLSRREVELLRGMFDGLTESAIAAEVSISVRTVRARVARLHRKLRVTHRVALVLRVLVEFLKLAAVPGSGVLPICARRTAGRCPCHR